MKRRRFLNGEVCRHCCISLLISVFFVGCSFLRSDPLARRDRSMITHAYAFENEDTVRLYAYQVRPGRGPDHTSCQMLVIGRGLHIGDVVTIQNARALAVLTFPPGPQFFGSFESEEVVFFLKNKKAWLLLKGPCSIPGGLPEEGELTLDGVRLRMVRTLGDLEDILVEHKVGFGRTQGENREFWDMWDTLSLLPK